MTTITTHEAVPTARTSLRPAWRWLFSAGSRSAPPGYLAHGIVGGVDSLPAAVIGGAVTGAVVGTVQWMLRRDVTLGWIAASALGYSAGLAAGAALVDHRTDRPSLALMGAVTGAVVGMAQGRVLGNTRRAVEWTLATVALFPIGWMVSASIGVDVAEQWSTFGLSGALVVAAAQSTVVNRIIPTTSKAVTS